MVCYTCAGDNGTTSILGRCNIEKDDERIEALGCFDELNSVIGVAAAFSDSKDAVGLLKSVQDDVHTICAELAAELDAMPRITEKHIERIERIVDDAEKFLEPQMSFIFPGGASEAALLHFARTVARRAERQLVRLSKTTEVSHFLLKYTNRLSSLFHVMARVENKKANVREEKPSYKYFNKN